jgi:hypothetical protein
MKKVSSVSRRKTLEGRGDPGGREIDETVRDADQKTPHGRQSTTMRQYQFRAQRVQGDPISIVRRVPGAQLRCLTCGNARLRAFSVTLACGE